MSEGLRVETVGNALIVRFIQPHKRNPLSTSVLDELEELIASVSASASKVVFTGTSEAFASGADLREIAAVNGSNASDFARRGQRVLNAVALLKARTIAAVNGYCFGGGLDLALSCKTRIASPRALFAHPGVRLGIITGWGGTQRLPRLIGEAAAMEMFLTGEPIDAERALAIGLIARICEEPLQAALQL